MFCVKSQIYPVFEENAAARRKVIAILECLVFSDLVEYALVRVALGPYRRKVGYLVRLQERLKKNIQSASDNPCWDRADVIQLSGCLRLGKLVSD